MATTRAQPRKRAAKDTSTAPLPHTVEPPPPDDQPPPTHVIGALARVQQFIGGVPKMSSADHRKRIGTTSNDNEPGVKYPYRSIDQITQAAQPLLGRYGIAIVPTAILELTVTDLTMGTPPKPWTDTRIKIAWTIYGPGGVEDRISAESVGLGRDNSDKGPNKATTAAYKNLVLRILAIGDPDDDPDAAKHVTDTPPVDAAVEANVVEANEAFERVRSFAGDQDRAAELRHFGAANGRRGFDNIALQDPEWRAAVLAEIDRLESPAADADALADALDPNADPAPEDLFQGEGYGA